MNLLKFKTTEGNPVAVNPNFVSCVHGVDNAVDIYFSGEKQSIRVQHRDQTSTGGNVSERSSVPPEESS